MVVVHVLIFIDLSGRCLDIHGYRGDDDDEVDDDDDDDDDDN